MVLMVERIVDGGVHAEETLGGCCRLEAQHLALSLGIQILRGGAHAKRWFLWVAGRRDVGCRGSKTYQNLHRERTSPIRPQYDGLRLSEIAGWVAGLRASARRLPRDVSK